MDPEQSDIVGRARALTQEWLTNPSLLNPEDCCEDYLRMQLWREYGDRVEGATRMVSGRGDMNIYGCFCGLSGIDLIWRGINWQIAVIFAEFMSHRAIATAASSKFVD